MNNQPLSLEYQFEVKRLKLYLDTHPQESLRLAIAHFEDYLELVHEYKKLDQKYKSNSLPPITKKIYARLQSEYYDLREEYIKTQKENAYLKKENHDLMQLIDAMTDDKSPLPDFVEAILD